ncbi:MAG: branched-chain amino acid ABC transporter permease [Bacillota bacterium]
MQPVVEQIKISLSQRWWILLAAWLIVPLFIRNWSYGLHVLIMMAVYVLLTQSLNLVMGLAGLLQLGHAAFFGIGAYFAGLLMSKLGWPFWTTLPLAFCGAALIGILVGLPSMRVGGDYLGIVTLGFGEITRLILTNWVSLTNGPMGVPGIPGPTLFGYSFTSKLPYFYLATAFALFTWFVMNRLINSKFGLQLLALRTDEHCARVLGVNTGLVKVTAFSISAAFAGLGGAFYSSYFSFISPDSFLFIDSLAVLCMLVVGGMGNLTGCAIGALILGVAPEVFRFMGDYRILLYGLLLTIMVIYRPSGIWGLDRRKRNAIRATCSRVRI